MKSYNKSINEVIQEYNTNITSGLNNQTVINHRSQYGNNHFVKLNHNHLLSQLFTELKEPLIIILLIMALITYFLEPTKWYISLILVLLVSINLMLGVYHFYKIRERYNLFIDHTDTTKVYRDAKIQTIKSEEVVIGDILVLEKGDYITSDARVIESHHLELDESILTNDDEPMLKQTNPIKDDNLKINEMRNMVFASTRVISGRGAAIVTSVGKHNIINQLINSSDYIKYITPLHNNFIKIFKIIALVFVIVAIFIFGVEIQFGINTIDAFMIAISAAFKTIPDDLAIVVSIILILNLIQVPNYNTIDTLNSILKI